MLGVRELATILTFLSLPDFTHRGLRAHSASLLQELKFVEPGSDAQKVLIQPLQQHLKVQLGDTKAQLKTCSL